MATTRKQMILFEDIARAYPGQWVALKVTERDSAGQPNRGMIVAHSRTKRHLFSLLGDLDDVCILYAGPVVPDGYGVVI